MLTQRQANEKTLEKGKKFTNSDVFSNEQYKNQSIQPFSLIISDLISVVPVEGLEPPRPIEQQILSLQRLPFRHTGKWD